MQHKNCSGETFGSEGCKTTDFSFNFKVCATLDKCHHYKSTLGTVELLAASLSFVYLLLKEE